MIEDMDNSIGEKEILDWIQEDYKNRIGWGFTAERDDLGNWRINTFGDGQKTAAVVRIPCQRKAVRIEDLERDIVKQFNRSQPFLKNKVTKIHLMRN